MRHAAQATVLCARVLAKGFVGLEAQMRRFYEEGASMTKEEVMKLAREAEFNKTELAHLGDNFVRLAELVAAAEREACAKVCDDGERPNLYGVRECAAAIRARSST
jgi:hypothetical protein